MKESRNISLGSRRSYKNSKWLSTDGFVGIVGIGIRSKPPMMPPFTNSKVPNHGINMSWALETLKWPGKVVLRLYWNPILNNKNIWLTLFLIFVPNNIKNPWTFLKGATFITANSTLHVTPWVTKSRTSHFRRCNLVSIEQLQWFHIVVSFPKYQHVHTFLTPILPLLISSSLISSGNLWVRSVPVQKAQLLWHEISSTFQWNKRKQKRQEFDIPGWIAFWYYPFPFLTWSGIWKNHACINVYI